MALADHALVSICCSKHTIFFKVNIVLQIATLKRTVKALVVLLMAWMDAAVFLEQFPFMIFKHKLVNLVQVKPIYTM